MSNISFDGIDLSTLGISVLGLDSQAMAGWESDQARILGRDIVVDLNGRHSTTTTEVAGMITAPLPPSPLYTVPGLISRLDEAKVVLDPEKGYRKLIVTGDGETTRYRWCRFSAMVFDRQKPVFRVPFTAFGASFQNLEPYWRRPRSPVTIAATNGTVPNTGWKTHPLITATVTSPVASDADLSLFTLDGITYKWKGIALTAGDKIRIDSSNLTVTRLPVSTTTWRDSVRAFSPSAFTSSPFPVIAKGGSALTNKSASLSTVVFEYDELSK